MERNNGSLSAGMKHFLFILLLIIFAVGFFFINTQMPSVGEDYSLEPWKFKDPPATLPATVNAVTAKIITSVTIWSPRVGEEVTIIMAAFPPIVFDIVNTLFFFVLIFILFIIPFGRFPDWNKLSDSFALFLIISLIFLLSPLLGQLYFWMSGTCNHTWSLTLLLGFALPFRFNNTHQTLLKNPLALILYTLYGFFAGITIENASIVVLGLLLAYFVITLRQKRITYRFIIPLVSFAVGIFYLIFSPVTTYRRIFYGSLGHETNLSGLNLYLTRLSRVMGDFFEVTWPLLIVFFTVLVIYLYVIRHKHNNSSREKQPESRNQLSPRMIIGLYLVFFIPVLLMITVPYIDDQRRAFDLFWLMSISCSAFMLTEIWKNLPSNLLRSIFVIFVAGILTLQYASVAKVYTQFNAENYLRLEAIYSALEDGESEIELPSITTKNSRIIETRETLPDLGDRYAEYYGFDSVTFQK